LVAGGKKRRGEQETARHNLSIYSFSMKNARSLEVRSERIRANYGSEG